jgi:nitrous oxidase accessory protein NosD
MRNYHTPRVAEAMFACALAMVVSILPPDSLRADAIMAASPADLSGCSIIVARSIDVTESSPNARRFASIQGAVDGAGPGDIVCISSADHSDERVAVTKSGTREAPIQIRALGEVKTAGFVVKGNHVAIEGFTVSNRGRDDKDGRGMGIYLAGAGVQIVNNTIVDTEGNGIGCEVYPPSCVDTVIARNTVRGADGSGIVVAGRRILVERNDVARSVMIDATDADGIRFFGSEITIRGNYVHDISDRGYPQATEPHTDCFQTFDNSKPPTTAVVIEGNVCSNVDHQCLIAGALEKRRSAVIKFRDNVCENNGSQAVLIRGVPFVEITNNLFLPSITYFGVVLQSGSTKATITNNAFVGAFRPYITDESSRLGLKADYNLVYDPTQRVPPDWWAEPNGMWGVDPMFVGSAGGGTFGAYRPAAGSPLVDAGNGEYNGSMTDIDGNPRISDGDGDGTAKIDVGPYEFTRRQGKGR